MRDPLLAENPFLKDYTECETWCYANSIDYEDPVVEEFFNGEHPGWVAFDAGVNDNGWLVPIIDGYRESLENSLGYYDRYGGGDDTCAASIFAVGPMDDELKQGILERFAELRAAYLLPVPGWLAEAPPRVARFVPDGNFAVQGELGGGSGLDSAWFWSYSPPPGSDGPWSLYSPTGELLRTGEPGEHWWQLYFEDFEEITGYAPDSDEIELYDWGGTVNGYDPESYEFVFCYTYTGEPLDDRGTDRPEVDPRSLAMLCGPEIPLVHAAQLHVEARQPCGIGIGVSDPAELDQELPIAIGFSPATGTMRYINVVAMDDEANPYAGLYREYDRWIYENHTMLCRDLGYNSNLQGDPWNANDAVYDRVSAQSTPEAPFNNFLPKVDDNGWLIPRDLQVELESQWLIKDISPAAQAVNESQFLGFELYSCGNMDHDLYAEFDAVPFVVRARSLPEIPAWLAENPPVSTMFLPGGGFITYGETGSLTTLTTNLPWVRYDAAGEELGRVTAGSDWWELTFPDYQEVKAGLGTPEQVNTSEVGGIIWFSKIDDGIYSELGAYDYLGQQVINPDPDEYALYFQPYPGDYLARMRAAQQEARQ